MDDAAAGMCRYLFAYGTLMSTASGAMGVAQRDRLTQESLRRPRPASAAGGLYDLGRYPGFVDDGAGGVVYGEVRELIDPAKTLAWLDDYEGIVSGEHDHNEYIRVERQVSLGDGSSLTAWVYLYRKPVAGLPLIAGGRWTAT